MGLFSDLFRGKDWIKNLPQGKHKLSRYHWYNMVSPSPWPILLSMNSLPVVIGGVGCLQGINDCFEILIAGFISFLFFFTMWNRDIVRESTFMGVHTKQVDSNTIMGFKLFLFTETMLFVSFFWAHLYSALYPSVFIGLSWPPVGLADLLLDPFDIPLTNTVILVYSGFTVTLSHLYLRRGSIFMSAVAMAVTILFGLAFLYIQYSEYTHAEFDISDGIYGSTFYMLTGFHGGHVIIGVSALIITLIRLIELHFSSYSHTGFKLALIYWHFVDVVWIFVFLIVYVLGSDLTYPNIVYYTNSDVLGCVVNIDQAFFGKWWRGVPVAREGFWYLNDSDSFERICWSQIYYNLGVKEIVDVNIINIYGDSSYSSWFTTKKISQYTTSEQTKLYYDSLVNDQSDLSKEQSKNLEESFSNLYQIYVNNFAKHSMLGEFDSQYLYGWEAYSKDRAHNALNAFYTIKILPSALNDSKDIDGGLENFYGKIVIYSEGHKIIENVSMKDYMNEEDYNYIFGTWDKFWPNNVNKGFIPKYLRVMVQELNGNNGKYPISLSREYS